MGWMGQFHGDLDSFLLSKFWFSLITSFRDQFQASQAHPSRIWIYEIMNCQAGFPVSHPPYSIYPSPGMHWQDGWEPWCHWAAWPTWIAASINSLVQYQVCCLHFHCHTWCSIATCCQAKWVCRHQSLSIMWISATTIWMAPSPLSLQAHKVCFWTTTSLLVLFLRWAAVIHDNNAAHIDPLYGRVGFSGWCMLWGKYFALCITAVCDSKLAVSSQKPHTCNLLMLQVFVSRMESAALQSLYLQHNFLSNWGALGNSSLPTSVAVCVQYNCMVPPPQSLCPKNVAGAAARPGYQCVKVAGTQN